MWQALAREVIFFNITLKGMSDCCQTVLALLFAFLQSQSEKRLPVKATSSFLVSFVLTFGISFVVLVMMFAFHEFFVSKRFVRTIHAALLIQKGFLFFD